MAVLDFPASPTVGQIATLTNGYSYQWDGAAWTIAASTGQAAGGDLSGTYPNPTVTKATSGFAVPSGNPGITVGPRTVRNRILGDTLADNFRFTVNAALNAAETAWTQDDSAKASWIETMTANGDWDLTRITPGLGAYQTGIHVRGSDQRVTANLVDSSITRNHISPGHAIRYNQGWGLPVSWTSTKLVWTNIFSVNLGSFGGYWQCDFLPGITIWPSTPDITLYWGWQIDGDLGHVPSVGLTEPTTDDDARLDRYCRSIRRRDTHLHDQLLFREQHRWADPGRRAGVRQIYGV